MGIPTTAAVMWQGSPYLRSEGILARREGTVFLLYAIFASRYCHLCLPPDAHI
jgi:hypothetical protein